MEHITYIDIYIHNIQQSLVPDWPSETCWCKIHSTWYTWMVHACIWRVREYSYRSGQYRRPPHFPHSADTLCSVKWVLVHCTRYRAKNIGAAGWSIDKLLSIRVVATVPQNLPESLRVEGTVIPNNQKQADQSRKTLPSLKSITHTVLRERSRPPEQVKSFDFHLCFFKTHSIWTWLDHSILIYWMPTTDD